MTEHDFERTARAWLDDGPSTMSDRALDAALAEIHVTRQRRASRPARRFPTMVNFTRFAAVAAGLAVAVVIGVSLLPGTGVGGPLPTPTPFPSRAPMVLPLAETPADYGMPLEPGTYVTDPTFEVQVTFTVPSGWAGHVGGPSFVELSSQTASVFFEIFENVYADPCDYTEGHLDPPPGPTANDLATALGNIPGVKATSPVDITVDGYRGKHLTLTAPDSFNGCTMSPEGYAIWQLPLGAIRPMTPSERTQVRILDIAGERLVIDAPEGFGSADQRAEARGIAEVEAILDSLQLEPGN